ncbi:MAG TPA: hypothetical protein GXX23_03500 [Firmicutes bacterium]|nr:hypothetical protein [Candidatus Fermentithermobacillaceae bacterium]
MASDRLTDASAANRKTAHFKEISVERLDIVDDDGVVRLAISNGERFPNPIIGGKEIATNRRPSAGMIFFNDSGDECGGLSFGNRHAGYAFDRYRQDQVVEIGYRESEDGRTYGFTVWDRPEIPVQEFVDRVTAIRAMPPGDERDAAEKAFRRDFKAPVRLFMGRERDKSVSVKFSDGEGRVRLRINVPAEGEASVEFLDENGTVVRRLPPGNGNGS